MCENLIKTEETPEELTSVKVIPVLKTWRKEEAGCQRSVSLVPHHK